MGARRLAAIIFILFLGILVGATFSVVSEGVAESEGLVAAVDGDLNDDGIVDIFDVVRLAGAFGSKLGDYRWDSVADLNRDEYIDILDVVLVSKQFGNRVFSQLKTFSNLEELESFLEAYMEQARQFEDLPSFSLFGGGDESFLLLSPDAETAPGHSTTNIQVEGVDEADIVKTDGEYLYVVSGQAIFILRAYPPDQAVLLSKIELNETYGVQIYVNEDKLAVLGNKYRFLPYEYPEGELAVFSYMYPEEAFMMVYDIADRANPFPTRTLTLNGSLSGSRMTGEYVYAVVNQPVTRSNGNETDLEVMLPRISGDIIKEVQPSEIHYVDAPDVYYRFTSVIAFNMIDDGQEPTYETILTGQTAQMYVSPRNMYLAVPNTKLWIPEEDMWEARDETLIYRIKLEKEEMVAEAEGAVPGYVLNQFSMDEYNSFFRIATTTWTADGSRNSLSILDMSLNIVGTLENLAPGERIYSARFMGGRCYLVTFRQIDPFFVIDVEDATAPKILGYLKIPGFSGYLHPYDEERIMGVGKEENNLKLSLFDVTDVTAPAETAKYVVQADWSDSTVLWDHKAFLFDKPKQLLALPVSTSRVWVDGRPYIEGFWQGAIIFDVSLEHGFTLRGNITHQNSADQLESGFEVKRILYIENVLYTISDKKIKMNHLETLQEINELEIP